MDPNHVFVAYVGILITPDIARRIGPSGRVALTRGVVLDVQDRVCQQCRRPYDDVGDQPCAAAVEPNHQRPAHLRGGNGIHRNAAQTTLLPQPTAA